MPIRTPLALLAAAAFAAPAAAQTRTIVPAPTYRPAPAPVRTAGPSGIVLRPGERLVSPAPRFAPVPSQPTYRTAVPQTRGTVVTRGPVTTAGGVRATGTIRQTAGYAPAPRPTYTAPQTTFGGSDQARAQAEANQMARTGTRGHVGGTIGRFEGVGWASSGTPSTCTPPAGMRLTADAIARGPGGVYRVRAWR